MSQSTRELCVCAYPQIVYPGHCFKCKRVHFHAERLRIQACAIPYRFMCAGKLSFKWHEILVRDIDNYVWITLDCLHPTVLGEKSILYFYQETILKKVREWLWGGHRIALEQQDEDRFKILELEDVMPQLSPSCRETTSQHVSTQEL